MKRCIKTEPPHPCHQTDVLELLQRSSVVVVCFWSEFPPILPFPVPFAVGTAPPRSPDAPLLPDTDEPVPFPRPDLWELVPLPERPFTTPFICFPPVLGPDRSERVSRGAWFPRAFILLVRPFIARPPERDPDPDPVTVTGEPRPFPSIDGSIPSCGAVGDSGYPGVSGMTTCSGDDVCVLLVGVGSWFHCGESLVPDVRDDVEREDNLAFFPGSRVRAGVLSFPPFSGLSRSSQPFTADRSTSNARAPSPVQI